MTISHTPRRSRRAAAAIGALALGGLLVGGITAPAAADPIGEVGNIDASFDGDGELIITKYEKSTDNGTDAGTGGPATVAGNTIDDVTFTLTPVLFDGDPLNLLSNEGWEQVADFEDDWLASAPTTVPDNYSLGSAQTETTSNGGVATFDQLDFGLYLVQETDAPDEVTDRALPFLVTIPFPTADLTGNSNEWLYTVNVYPKNAVASLAKQVNTTDDAYLTEASYVSWTITAGVPQLPEDETFTQFRLVDAIDTGELEFVASDAALPDGVSGYAVRVYNAAGTLLSSLDDDMYVLDEDDAEDGMLELRFTDPAGLEFLEGAQGGHVEFDVPTLVLNPGTETLVNDVTSYINDSELEADAEQEFGEVRIHKFALTGDDGDVETPLVGATFQLYADLSEDGAADEDELVTIDGADAWTVTALDGTLRIPGLKPGSYLLVETEAPVGYRTPTGDQLGSHSNPFEVEILEGGEAEDIVEVENQQVAIWELPFTGGNGVVTFTVAGIALMALALGFALLAFRRQKQAAQH